MQATVISITASCGGQGCSTHEEILPKGVKVLTITVKAEAA